MDIWFLKLNNFLAVLSLPLGIFVFSRLFSLAKKTAKDDAQKISLERSRTFLIFFMGGYIACLIIFNSVFRAVAFDKFCALSRKPVSALVIEDGKAAVVEDPAAIAEFFKIIRSSAGVAAHHSSPVDHIVISLPGVTGHRYAIGRDSSVPDEFWLNWDSYEKKTGSAKVDMTLKQFRSRAMTQWLKRYQMI